MEFRPGDEANDVCTCMLYDTGCSNCVLICCPCRYKSRHHIQFFGRGHVAGIDIKVMYYYPCVSMLA